MDPSSDFIILAIIGIPIILWLAVRSSRAEERIDKLSRRQKALEAEVAKLRQARESELAEKTQSATAPEHVPPPRPAAPAPVMAEPPPRPRPAASEPPIIPGIPVIKPAPTAAAVPPSPTEAKPRSQFAEPPPIPPQIAPDPLSWPASNINWEQFMGVKGFAWIGGLALFLGVAFFVKYSFDNNLVPPALRVTIGFLVGLSLVAAGVVTSRKNYSTLTQTLCATGVVILYAVTFACRSLYHFQFFSPLATFAVMVLVTALAFGLAVGLNALVVAILGMLGGFLTPILLSTGQDNPLGLFGYIAILDAGLIVVALRKRWDFLTSLAAGGTVLMQLGWLAKFFEVGRYFEGNKILIALAVLAGFTALWLAANSWAKRRGQMNPWLSLSALGLAGVALAVTTWFLSFQPLTQRPWLIFSFVFLVDAMALAVTLLDEEVAVARTIFGVGAFALLGIWTETSLSSALLNAALVFYFIFALLHTALPVVLQRRRGSAAKNPTGHFFPIIALALVLLPLFKLADVSFMVWPFILLVDLLAIALAVVTATLLPVLVVLGLTLVATAALIFKIPDDLTGLPISLGLLAAFTVFFVGTSVWLIKKFKPDAFKTGIQWSNDPSTPGDVAALLPAFSVSLPFLLLIMATLHLPLANPSPVFGLALLLVVLLLGLTRLFTLDWLPAIGLACVAALECTWHFNQFDPKNPNEPLHLILGWYLVFYAVFAVFPFLFRQRFENKVVPWAAAAMTGVPQFLLVYRFVKVVWPNSYMGLLPAAFAVPALLGLFAVRKNIPAMNQSRLGILAWFGGVALFFITAIFPIQFKHQWITLGWGLEGAALLWLWRRVPHPGLRLVGVGLLIAAFVRLALNPAVLEYHPRSSVPIFNWYLYAYGVVTVCLFLGARLLAESSRGSDLKPNYTQILATLGTVLAFLLLNIEIADYFSEPGSTLTFQFSGNFARDMTYSIAWALFALALLIYGIVKNIPATRYAAMGLLCVTLLKLFFHDLAQLNQLYRIGAFIGVAIIAMLASFAYQKFFLARSPEKDSKSETVQ